MTRKNDDWFYISILFSLLSVYVSLVIMRQLFNHFQLLNFPHK